jgi:uncharacterized protein YegJ (DUF2314 family)
MFMRNYFFASLLLILISCTNNTNNTPQKEGPGDTYTVNSNDPEMTKASEKAMQTLYQFDLALKNKTDSQNNFSLKVRFTIDNGGEQLWIDDIQIENGNYTGVVGNRPYWIKGLHLGDTIKVNKPDITDWMYLENNILHGGYTTRLLRNRMSSSERKDFDAALLYKIAE